LRDEDENLIGFAKIMRDRTQGKLKEEEIEKSNRRLKEYAAIVELSQVLIRNINDEIVFWNKGVEHIYGWSKEEAIGRISHELLKTKFPTPLEDIKQILLDTGEWSGELTHYRKDSSQIVVSSHWVLHKDEQGNPAAILESNHDITELQAARLEAEEARAEAQAANRTKDEFLATVSHELRTPMTSLLGWARLLKLGHMRADQFTRAIDAIERNAELQSKLIDDLLDISRIISGKLKIDLQPLELAEVVNAAIDVIQPIAEAKEIRIEPVLDRSIIINGDPSRLHQIVWNLLTNAIKFTNHGGRIQVTVESRASDVCLTVSDTGKGISATFLPYVFDRFKQEEAINTRKHEGLGIGLAVVRHLVEMHGGTVEAYSEGEGKGASFTVRLPNYDVKALEHEEIRKVPAIESVEDLRCPKELEGVKILAVEDEPDARDLISMVLKRCGAEVVAVETVEEALKVVKEIKPDLLLSDIVMSGEDGYTLIRKLRQMNEKEGGSIPAIALTVFSRAEDRTKLLRAGYTAHLSKPVHPEELVAILTKFIRR
jgi:PAS domain S-box-containing protein